MRINIVRPFHPSSADIVQEFASILESGMVTNHSQYVQAFERKLHQYLDSQLPPHVTCNGELALFNLIAAWRQKIGCRPSETFDVLVPSFTFSGTVNAIVAQNLTPVFCDVDESLVLDLDKVSVSSNSIKMLIAVGAYGNLIDLEYLREFSSKHNLIVILDNAPAFASRYRGKFPWEFGFSEMLSFHATKIFSSMEGGATVVNDPEIAEYLVRLRDFGQYEKIRGDVDIPGLNAKMTEVCALVGLRNLEKIDSILSCRALNIARYRAFFGDLEAQGHLRLMRVQPEVTCTYLYFPIILNEEASEFVQFMGTKNIAVRRYYTACHDLKFYRGRYRELDLSFTNSIKDRIVALPLHTIMSDEEMNYLFASVKEYLAR